MAPPFITHSADLGQVNVMKMRDAFLLTIVCVLATPLLERSVAAQQPRACLSTQEARAAISRFHLVDSIAAMRSAAGKMQAEALSGKLCRWNDTYVYEIALLARDGRVIHVIMNATNGKTIGAQGQIEE